MVLADVAPVDIEPIVTNQEGTHLFDIVIQTEEGFEGLHEVSIPREGIAQFFMSIVLEGTHGSFEYHPDNVITESGYIFGRPQ